MRYDITTNKAPGMPNLGKGTECIKLLLSQASKDMYEPLVPMLFPSLGAHISDAEFQYPDRSWKKMCGLMAQLVGDSGCNKGQLTDLVKAICRDFQQLLSAVETLSAHGLYPPPSAPSTCPVQRFCPPGWLIAYVTKEPSLCYNKRTVPLLYAKLPQDSLGEFLRSMLVLGLYMFMPPST